MSGGTSTAGWQYTGFYSNDYCSLDHSVTLFCLAGMDAVRPIISMFKYLFNIILFVIFVFCDWLISVETG